MKSRSANCLRLSGLVLLVSVTTGGAQSAEDVSKVHEDVLAAQNPHVRPEKDLSSVTVVNVSFHLISVNSLDTAAQKLSSNAWLKVTWRNAYFQWEPAQHSGVGHIFPEPHKMWLPRLTVVNSVNEMKPVGNSYSFVTATFDGLTTWFPAEVFETFCKIDVVNFPFDVQTCNLTILNWAEDISEVDLQPTKESIDLDSYRGNGQWELVGTQVHKDVAWMDSSEHPLISFQLTLRRQPALVLVTAILPISVLSILNVFVFVIPIESGERLSFSMSAFLSYGVFLGFILDSLPSSGEDICFALILTSVQLLLSAGYVLLCMLSSRLFHRDDGSNPVPQYVISAVVCLEILFRLKRTSPSRLVARQNVVGISEKSSGQGHEDSSQLSSGKGGAALSDSVSRELPRVKMTWLRVSHALDRLFFCIFFLAVLVLNTVSWFVVKSL